MENETEVETQRPRPVEIKPLQWAFFPFCYKLLLEWNLGMPTASHSVGVCACVRVSPVGVEGQEALALFLSQPTLLCGPHRPRLALCLCGPPSSRGRLGKAFV